MVASLKYAKDLRDRLHNLDPSDPEHQRIYEDTLEKITLANETHVDEKTGKAKINNEVYPDNANPPRKTIGIGFNMDRGKKEESKKTEESQKEWKAAFGDAVSFWNAYNGKIKITDEQAWHLFRTGIKIRRAELIDCFKEENWKRLKGNERAALEDAYYNGPGLLTIIHKKQRKPNKCLTAMQNYVQTGDVKYIHEARH
jgi:hypothetical protein